MSGAELHIHTTASDGVLSPQQAVEHALALDLDALAITDHDTMAGVPEAQRRAGREIEIVPGIEISCEEDGAPVHLLAYWLDPSHPELGEELAKIRESRQTRVVRMVARLQELGYPITLERVLRFVQRGTPGRPHVARALVEEGVIRHPDEAFTPELIGTEGAAYVEKYALEPSRAVRLVRESGGVPVIAHPGLHRGSEWVSESIIESMVEAGLVGLEVVHIGHTPEQVAHFGALAGRLGLVSSAGSDCHGERQPMSMGQCRAT
ncbi:MAG: PHP domain-containing protein [Actinomycetota bacterium]